MYIILEGVDTCGKTTQIELLKKSFPNAIFTKEPGGSHLGEKIREILLGEKNISKNAELFLFLADRAEHYQNVIKNRGDRYIFSDRGFISGIAYALSNNPNLDIDFLIEINRFALENSEPNLVILFKTDEKLIKERLSQKKEDKIEQRGVDYLLKTQSNMIKILNRLNINYISIDANKTIEEINREILKVIFEK